MSDSEALFSVLRQSADADCVAAIERAVRDATDRELCRINVLDFAGKRGLDEERATAAFLHASRLGLFELSWNVLCPACGGVLDVSATLKTVNRDEYDCGLCASATSRRSTKWSKSPSPSARGSGASPATIPTPCRKSNISVRFSRVPESTCRTIWTRPSPRSPSIRSNSRPAKKPYCQSSCPPISSSCSIR